MGGSTREELSGMQISGSLTAVAFGVMEHDDRLGLFWSGNVS